MAWTYNRKYAAHLGNEVVIVPDQVANIDALIESYPEDTPMTALPSHAQKHHDEAGTVFPLADGRLARLDGEAYGLWTAGTGDMVVQLTPDA